MASLILFVTSKDTHAGRCRIQINNGGVGPWCSFDFIVNRQLSLPGVQISLPNEIDDQTQTFFLEIKRGILLGVKDLKDHYNRRLTQLTIRITHVYTHPIVTTPEGCERFGRLWIVGFGHSETVQSIGDISLD